MKREDGDCDETEVNWNGRNVLVVTGEGRKWDAHACVALDNSARESRSEPRLILTVSGYAATVLSNP